MLSVARSTLTHRRRLVADVTAAIARGYAVTLSDPARSVGDLVARSSGLDRVLLQAQAAALRDAFRGPAAYFGQLDPGRLRAWAQWEARFGIVAAAPDVGRAFDPSFAAAAAGAARPGS